MTQLPVIPPDMETHDNTMMSSYSYCERLYALSHILHRKSRFTKPALSFGSVMHVGLDEIYTAYQEDDQAGRTRDIVAAAERAITTMRATNFEDPEDDYRTLARAETVLIDYLKKYQEDRDFQQIVFTETAHDVSFPDGFKWGGIMDLWVQYLGGDYPVEHKTTSRFGQYYYDDMYRSPQAMGYYLTGAALRGLWPQGVLYNVIVVRKTNNEFDRRPLVYPHWLVDECRRMQIQNYREIYAKRAAMESQDDAWNPEIWKPNFYNCVGKYGRCAMYDACHAPPQNRDFVLNNEYEEKVWNWRTVRGEESGNEARYSKWPHPGSNRIFTQ